MLPRASHPFAISLVAVQPLVLVVADDSEQRRSLVSALAANGFRSLEAGPGSAALTHTAMHAPDLVLVDVNADVNRRVPEGIGVAARLRDRTSAPILVVLADPDEPSRVAVLEAGANDYIVRPFGVRDLVARIRVWLKQGARPRAARAPVEVPRERLRLDAERRSLFVDGREVHVTPIERKLVIALVRSGGEGMTEGQAIAAVWGRLAQAQARYLRMLIRQLRQKIERDPSHPRHLLSTAEGGYRLKCD